jgi:hypothetical protein
VSLWLRLSLSAQGSSGASTCPWLGAAPGPLRAPTAQGSSGAATCHLGFSTHLLVQSSSGAATRHLGSAGCKQINKYPLVTRPS